jgi:acetyl-CoA carboxylase carboxyl transferase subunit beta
LRSGIVDAIVPELPDAADEPIEFSQRLASAIAAEVHALRDMPGAERIAERLRRYRGIGLP